MEISLAILVSLGVPLLLGIAFYKLMLKKPTNSAPLEIDQAALDSAEKELKESGERDWVVLKRCHGPAYNHSTMTDIVAKLNAEGVEATYDVIASSSAEGGVTNFMIKVIRGEESRAFEVLKSLE